MRPRQIGGHGWQVCLSGFDGRRRVGALVIQIVSWGEKFGLRAKHRHCEHGLSVGRAGKPSAPTAADSLKGAPSGRPQLLPEWLGRRRLLQAPAE